MLESGHGSTCTLILNVEEITQPEQLVVVLEPLARATEYLAAEKYSCVSEAQPPLTALLKKHLKPQEGDPALVLDIKSAVMSNLERHFSNDTRQKYLRLASVLDPKHPEVSCIS